MLVTHKLFTQRCITKPPDCFETSHTLAVTSIYCWRPKKIFKPHAYIMNKAQCFRVIFISFTLHTELGKVQKNNPCSQYNLKGITILRTEFLISFSATRHLQLNASFCQQHKNHITATIIWNCTHRTLHCNVSEISHTLNSRTTAYYTCHIWSKLFLSWILYYYHKNNHFYWLLSNWYALSDLGTHDPHAYTDNTNNIKQTAVVFRQC